MFRYLSAAFWARPALPVVGPIPANAVALFCCGVLGALISPGIWLIGAGLEIAYLYALSTNPRFQKVVDAEDLQAGEFDRQRQWNELITSCDLSGRERFSALQEKIKQIATMQDAARAEQGMVVSNRKTLEQLTFVYLKLLVAETNLKQANRIQAKLDELLRHAAQLEYELKSDKLTPALRESKSATLQIYRKRIAGLQRREQTLEEINSDLQRIEAQLDLALENAVVEGRPQTISADLSVASIMLDSDSGSGTYFAASDSQIVQLNKAERELGVSQNAPSEVPLSSEENSSEPPPLPKERA